MLIYDEGFGSLFSYYETVQTAILVCCIELILLSLTGLLAIWGGLGRPHWFVRAVVVLAGLALWLVVPAYEPMLVFFIQTAVAALLLSWARCRRATAREGTAEDDRADSAIARRLPQFALRDLLLWTVVVAVASAAAAQVTTDVWESWWKYMLFGTGYGLLTVLAAWVALGRCRWWLRAIGGCLLGFPSVLIAGWILLARWSGLFGGKSSARATLRYAARVGVVAVSLLIVLPSAFVYYTLVTPTPIPAAELPEPNGYDDLMRAGKTFENVTVPEREDGAGALRAFVEKHASALQIARTGLGRKCQVPLRYVIDDLPHIQGIRGLARAFLAEAFLAEEEGRTEDAMRIHYDNLRLGTAVARGGTLVHRLVGLGIEGIVIHGLNGLSGGLSPQRCRELIEILETPEAGWEPFEDCLTRDQAWEDGAYGWRGRIWHRIYSLSEQALTVAVIVENADFRHEARKRLLIGKLAIRCYRLERGELPSTLADLVPEYLPAVPEDPFSEEPLIYRRTGDGYLLYSVGVDGLDDGGHRADPKHAYAVDKDLLLDMPADDG